MTSIDESSVDHNSDGKSISMDAIKNIWDENYVHPNINVRNYRSKTHDPIIQAKIDCKEE